MKRRSVRSAVPHDQNLSPYNPYAADVPDAPNIRPLACRAGIARCLGEDTVHATAACTHPTSRPTMSMTTCGLVRVWVRPDPPNFIR